MASSYEQNTTRTTATTATTAEFVTSAEAVRVLKVSVDTLRRWAKQDKIDIRWTGGDQRQYNVEKYLQGQEAKQKEKKEKSDKDPTGNAEAIEKMRIKTKRVVAREKILRKVIFIKGMGHECEAIVREIYPDHIIVTDPKNTENGVGQKMICGMAIDGELSEIVFNASDFTPFEVSIINFVCNKLNIEVISNIDHIMKGINGMDGTSPKQKSKKKKEILSEGNEVMKLNKKKKKEKEEEKEKEKENEALACNISHENKETCVTSKDSAEVNEVLSNEEQTFSS